MVERCMTTNDLHQSYQLLSDIDLLAEAKRLAARERDAMVAVVAALMEIDSRKLYLGEGYSSLFGYCTQALHLSEHAAYSRIEAARTARRVPADSRSSRGRLADADNGRLALAACHCGERARPDRGHAPQKQA